MKLCISFDDSQMTFHLPKGISKENIEQSFRNELSTSSLFLEIVENGKSYFINKNKITMLYVEEENDDK